MAYKKNDKKEIDREAKSEFKSAAKNKRKSQRHHSKECLNNFIQGSVDDDELYDIMGEFEYSEWR